MKVQIPLNALDVKINGAFATEKNTLILELLLFRFQKKF